MLLVGTSTTIAHLRHAPLQPSPVYTLYDGLLMASRIKGVVLFVDGVSWA